jgi:DNA-binding NarL/FixJ family response regulator
LPKKILIAETNGYLSETLVGLFSSLGYEVVGAASADNAEIINHIQEFQPDLFLIDFDLSKKMDIGTIRAQFPEMKVVASLWHETVDLFTEISKEIGFDGYSCKYSSRDDLLKSIKALLP